MLRTPSFSYAAALKRDKGGAEKEDMQLILKMSTPKLSVNRSTQF